MARDDLLERAEPLAVHKAVVLVDEEELPISRDPGLGQVALVELPDGEALDRECEIQATRRLTPES